MTFDSKYYQDKKAKLIQKRQGLLQGYVDGAFNFTNEVIETNKEIAEIDKWEAENKPVVSEKPEEIKQLEKESTETFPKQKVKK